LADGIDILWQEAGFRDRVDQIEGQHPGRVVLQCPRGAVRVEEILPRGPVESLAPRKSSAALQSVREPLRDLDLQRIVFRTASGRSGAGDRPKLGEGVQRALQTIP